MQACTSLYKLRQESCSFTDEISHEDQLHDEMDDSMGDLGLPGTYFFELVSLSVSNRKIGW